MINMYVIADFHAKSNEDIKYLRELIRKYTKDDILILNGDILDFTKIPISRLEYTIDMFSDDNVIYIKGNHDIVVDEIGIPCVDKYISDVGITYEHGHRYEALLDTNFFTLPETYNNLFRRLCYSKSSTQKLSHLLWKYYCKFMLNRKSKYNTTKQILNEMCKSEYVICGHTHYFLMDTVSKCCVLDAAVNGVMYEIDEELFIQGNQHAIKPIKLSRK